jgi:hypothetical protein
MGLYYPSGRNFDAPQWFFNEDYNNLWYGSTDDQAKEHAEFVTRKHAWVQADLRDGTYIDHGLTFAAAMWQMQKQSYVKYDPRGTTDYQPTGIEEYPVDPEALRIYAIGAKLIEYYQQVIDETMDADEVMRGLRSCL